MSYERPLEITRRATFERRERRVRYALTRMWDTTKPLALYIGVNPSTASESEDDPTVRKLIGFSAQKGLGGFMLCNILPYVTPHITQLRFREVQASHMEKNEATIRDLARGVSMIIPCWGSRDKLPKRMLPYVDAMQTILGDLEQHVPMMAFGFTKSGDPKHPLMLAYNTQLQLWTSERSQPCDPTES